MCFITKWPFTTGLCNKKEMGDVYALVKKAKTKFPQASLVLSGALRRRDVSWRRIGALNDRYDWVARTLGVTFVDPNSWIEDWDFGRDVNRTSGSPREEVSGSPTPSVF
jgi:hypothetical protein